MTSCLCLVTGGSGFLGRHLVEFLLHRGENVRVFDIQQTFQDSRVDSFIVGDIREYQHLRDAMVGVDVVYHAAASSSNSTASEAVEVNQNGTQNVIRACKETGVKRLIFTSSSCVVMDGTDIKNGDERIPFPRTFISPYAQTKAAAEKAVLAHNQSRNDDGSILQTVALRPHGLFGPRDTHFLTQLMEKARNGKLTHMIGDGTNITSWTYIENAVYAHALVADCLASDEPISPVGGKTFFITNGEPRRVWEFISTLLKQIGCLGPRRCISVRLAYMLATFLEVVQVVIGWLVPYRPAITRSNIFLLGNHSWFSIDKARRELGYKPIVPLSVGIERTVKFFSMQTHSSHNLFLDDASGS